MENPAAKSQDAPEMRNTEARERDEGDGELRPENVEMMGVSPKVDSVAVEEGSIEELAAVVEGWGDPASTMLW